MRTSLTVSLILLAVVIAGGAVCEGLTAQVSAQYVSAAEELTALTEAESWQRAGETARAYLERWEKTERWLQILINHDDTDDVTLALQHVLAGIEARDVSACLTACSTLRECAGHIHHRDAFTWG
ncbi:MAG: DUF4363 family protein, partial [Aristaeellaceae bacterium]